MQTTGRSEWQLVAFTILTQMAVGVLVIWGLAVWLIPTPIPFSDASLYPTAVLGVTLGSLLLGTLAATLHLGRPSRAGFSVANFRRSWLSREVLSGICFDLFATILFVRRLYGEGYEPLDEFLGRFTSYIINRLEKVEPDSVEVIITHDIVIDIIQRKFLGIVTGAYNLNIPFLGGLGFTKRNGKIIGRCKGSDFPLAASFETLAKERL